MSADPLYLIRHGQAEYPPSGMPDRDRALTDEGRADVDKQAKKLLAKGVTLHAIRHSPYKRAIETALIVHKTFPDAALVEMPELIPGGSAESILMNIAEIERPTLLVSHLPVIAEVASSLTGTAVTFYPGTCIGVYRKSETPFSAQLLWTEHPF
ncbi:phosphohistidine phosphatase SixA [Acanthopleuribacter pedis]|uniref:Phosphohistidine phosphatase SixA n=1 Tax=Acanthopleuribacter pedis TaxID=442870 RepID=A0A8J7U341_9BACT|nr:phosphohistidine phosphatase SixA [Acanthopleuribacter pedis]MBO1319983.1 phosphohistidine phosphatase SixA [Acanthopleuribacter pedis]